MIKLRKRDITKDPSLTKAWFSLQSEYTKVIFVAVFNYLQYYKATEVVA